MENIIAKIDDLNAALKKLLPIKVEFDAKLNKKFRLEINYNSNHIEGNTLTYAETELFLIFDNTTGNHALREYEEMKAHDLAMVLVKEWAADYERPLTETQIKNLNEIILVKPFWKQAVTYDGQITRRQITIGNYKQYSNSVLLKNGEIFEYASVTDTPILMGELLEWYGSEEQKKELHPVILAAILHYKFVCIHPFDDGNGRISRLLTNYVLLKNNLPQIVIKSADKQNYLFALNQADTGDITAFINYVAKQLVWSLELSIKAAKGENIDELDDLDKELYVLQRELKGGNVLETIANADVICDVVEENLIPLFILIEQKCEGLKEFFFDTSRKIDVGFTDRLELSVGTIDSNWQHLKENWLHNQVRAAGKRIKKLRYIFELKGFKKTISADSIFIVIEITFQNYNYSIRWNNLKQTQQFAYNQILNTEQKQNYITPIFKNIISKIKKLNKID